MWCSFPLDISIHVPRVGDDRLGRSWSIGCSLFLSTSPVWGTTQARPPDGAQIKAFLSTSPVWGTTVFVVKKSVERRNFYPRPPCGGRRPLCLELQRRQVISIHVPRVGDDLGCARHHAGAGRFLSTSPVWGTTDIQTSYSDSYSFLSTSPVWGTTANVTKKHLCALPQFVIPRYTTQIFHRHFVQSVFVHAA